MNWDKYATEQRNSAMGKYAESLVATVGRITQLTTQAGTVPIPLTASIATTTFGELERYVPANDNYPRVVGLMGYGGAGKSEVKKYLVEHRGLWGEHIKAPLANMVRSLLRDAGIKEEDLDRYIDGDLKRTPIPQLGGKTCTEIQQYQGTEFGRDYIDEDLWLNLWVAKAEAALSNGQGVVQESVRFPNEASWIRRNGGIILEITRPGFGPLNGHKSEVRPAIADAVVPNTGSIAQLHGILDEVLSGWAA